MFIDPEEFEKQNTLNNERIINTALTRNWKDF